jgi:hypothetical protein
VRALAPHLSEVRELGGQEGVVALAAGAAGVPAVVVPDGDASAARASIDLNNVEAVVHIEGDTPSPAADDAIVVIRDRERFTPGPTHPLLLAPARLQVPGYRTVAVGGGWTLALDPARHAAIDGLVRDWLTQRAQERRARVRAQLRPSALRTRAFHSRLFVHHGRERLRLRVQRWRARSR